LSLFIKQIGEKKRTRTRKEEWGGSEFEYMKNLLILIVLPTVFWLVESDGVWVFGVIMSIM
jgi:hypothetical protein